MITKLLFCCIFVVLLVDMAESKSKPSETMRVTATAMLTNVHSRREVMMPTISTFVTMKRKRRRRALPLENPHPEEENDSNPSKMISLRSVAKAEKARSSTSDKVEGEEKNSKKAKDDFDSEPASDKIDNETPNFDDEEDEEEDDDEDLSPTAAGFTDSQPSRNPSSSSESSISEKLKEQTKTTDSDLEKNNETPEPEESHYELNNNDDKEESDSEDNDSDDAEDPDDVAAPTDTTARKAVIHPTNPTQLKGQRKMEIEKRLAATDVELRRLLQLEADIDEMTKHLPQFKRSQIIKPQRKV